MDDVFDALRALLVDRVAGLDVKRDEPGDYYVDTFHLRDNKQALFFGAVKTGKRYVSYHLMPVYVNPGLLDGLSPELRKRMQGKSCFNFTKIDLTLFEELAELTERGLADYRDRGFVAN